MVREESVYVVLVRSSLRPKLQKTGMISLKYYCFSVFKFRTTIVNLIITMFDSYIHVFTCVKE